MVLGAGVSHEHDPVHQVRALVGEVAGVIMIDQDIGGYEHNWRIPEINASLMRLVACEHIIAVAYAFDCGSHSPLRFLRPGPPILFDSDHLSGIPGSDGLLSQAIVNVRDEYDMGLCILRAATTAGKPVIGESAVGRGKGAPFAFADSLYSKHVNAFTYPPMALFNDDIGATAIYSDQGATGSYTAKTT